MDDVAWVLVEWISLSLPQPAENHNFERKIIKIIIKHQKQLIYNKKQIWLVDFEKKSPFYFLP